ncbi:MAG: hypothetical protein MI976_06635, partial [Pseudomonadales bacterium]|nr:hypothetical protein [Pseudomonadales bacterium]
CNSGAGGGVVSRGVGSESFIPESTRSLDREETPSIESDANDILNDGIFIVSRYWQQSTKTYMSR